MIFRRYLYNGNICMVRMHHFTHEIKSYCGKGQQAYAHITHTAFSCAQVSPPVRNPNL